MLLYPPAEVAGGLQSGSSWSSAEMPTKPPARRLEQVISAALWIWTIVVFGMFSFQYRDEISALYFCLEPRSLSSSVVKMLKQNMVSRF